MIKYLLCMPESAAEKILSIDPHWKEKRKICDRECKLFVLLLKGKIAGLFPKDPNV